MHGPTCIFWANLTPFSLFSAPRAARAGTAAAATAAAAAAGGMSEAESERILNAHFRK